MAMFWDMEMEQHQQPTVEEHSNQQLPTVTETDHYFKDHIIMMTLLIWTMEIEESEQDRESIEGHMSQSDDSDTGSDEDDQNAPDNHDHPLFPAPPMNIGLPQGFGRRGRVPRGLGQFQGLGGGLGGICADDDELFEGEGHRLGGKEVLPMLGDIQISGKKMHDASTVSITTNMYMYIYFCTLYTHIHSLSLSLSLSLSHTHTHTHIHTHMLCVHTNSLSSCLKKSH